MTQEIDIHDELLALVERIQQSQGRAINISDSGIGDLKEMILRDKKFCDYESPPLATEEDGFICDMALQYGAEMLGYNGEVYVFNQEQLLAYTKANRVAAPANP